MNKRAMLRLSRYKEKPSRRLLNVLGCILLVIGGTTSSTCPKKKTFKLVNNPGEFAWKILAEYGPLPGEKCERTCRQYFECRAYLMKWLDNSHLGHCQLLSDAIGGQGYDPYGTKQSLYGRLDGKHNTIH